MANGLFSNIGGLIGLGSLGLGAFLGNRSASKGVEAALGLTNPVNINTPFASTQFSNGTLTNILSPQAQGIATGLLDASAANLAAANIPAEAFAQDFSQGLFRLVEQQEAEARSRELDKLHAQGRFGTTGGTAQYGELLQGQALAGLTRALTAENLGFQRQSEMFNRAIELANASGNLSQAQLGLALQGRNNQGGAIAANEAARKGDFISTIFSSFGNAALEAAGIENPLNAGVKGLFEALGIGGAAGPTIASNAGALGGSFSGGAGAATGLGEAVGPVTGQAAGEAGGGFLSSLFGGGGALGAGTGTGGALTGGIAAEGAFTGAAPSFAGLSGLSAAIPFAAPLGILGLSQIGAGPAVSVEGAAQAINRGVRQIPTTSRAQDEFSAGKFRTNDPFDASKAHSALNDALAQTSAPDLWNRLSAEGRQHLANALERQNVPPGVYPVSISRDNLGTGKAAQNSQIRWFWKSTWSDGVRTSGRSEAFESRRGKPLTFQQQRAQDRGN